MNILHIYFGRYREGNGIYTVLDAQLKWINKYHTDFSVTLMLTTPEKYEQADYKIIYYPDKKIKSFFTIEKYDLAILHGFFFMEYIKISKVLKSMGIPYYIKPHSSLTIESWKKSYFKKRIAYHFLGLKQLVNNSDGIIFINQEEKANSFNFDKTTLIERNGIEINENKHPDLMPNLPIRISFFSRIDFNHKGIDILLDSLAILKDEQIEFRFWGTGEKKEVARLEKAINQKKLKNVTYSGARFGTAKNEIFKGTDILILTSRYEGFPTVFTEALSWGIPAIITPGTNACFFEDEGIGWKCNLSPNEIANTIKLACREFETNYASIRKKCFEYAKNNLAINQTTIDSLTIYKAINTK